MPFTLTPEESSNIKGIVRAVMSQSELNSQLEDIHLYPDHNLDDENVLRIVITVNGDGEENDQEAEDVSIDILTALSPYLLHSPCKAFPVPYLSPYEDSREFISGLLNAASA